MYFAHPPQVCHHTLGTSRNRPHLLSGSLNSAGAGLHYLLPAAQLVRGKSKRLQVAPGQSRLLQLLLGCAALIELLGDNCGGGRAAAGQRRRRFRATEQRDGLPASSGGCAWRGLGAGARPGACRDARRIGRLAGHRRRRLGTRLHPTAKKLIRGKVKHLQVALVHTSMIRLHISLAALNGLLFVRPRCRYHCCAAWQRSSLLCSEGRELRELGGRALRSAGSNARRVVCQLVDCRSRSSLRLDLGVGQLACLRGLTFRSKLGNHGQCGLQAVVV
mmetsp:Transcript_88665/g.246212  ORF Transcript_88665/g.246212 Transcript_88665/m.246212 type:complete len:275 (+) Transcript_88665:96-920(+)